MIVDTLERVLRLQRGLAAKQRAIAEATAEIANAGWNVSAAKRKVVAAEEALAAQEAEIAELQAGLPELPNDGSRWLFGRVAEIRVERGVLERRIAKAETALSEATAEAEKDAWKWKSRAAAGGPAEPKAVTEAREDVARARGALKSHEEDNAQTLTMYDAHLTSAREQAEVAAWAAGGYEGARPECIERAAREFAEEMAEGCDRLSLKRAVHLPIFVSAGPVVPEESDPDPILDPSVEWGTPIAAEEYLNQLVPPPPPPEEFRPSTTGRMPASIKRLLEGRKAARARLAAVAPVM
jgi:hypothetical protein